MAETAAAIMRPMDMYAFSGLKSHMLLLPNDIGYSRPLFCTAMYIPGRFSAGIS